MSLQHYGDTIWDDNEELTPIWSENLEDISKLSSMIKDHTNSLYYGFGRPAPDKDLFIILHVLRMIKKAKANETD